MNVDADESDAGIPKIGKLLFVYIIMFVEASSCLRLEQVFVLPYERMLFCYPRRGWQRSFKKQSRFAVKKGILCKSKSFKRTKYTRASLKSLPNCNRFQQLRNAENLIKIRAFWITALNRSINLSNYN